MNRGELKRPSRCELSTSIAGSSRSSAYSLPWSRWRPSSSIGATLAAHEEALRPTLGLRIQEKLLPEAAAEVIWCPSGHRDVSLSF